MNTPNYPQVGVPYVPSQTSPAEPVQFIPVGPPGAPVTGIFPDFQPMIDRANAVLDQVKQVIPRIDGMLARVDALLAQLQQAGLTLTVKPGSGTTITVRPGAEAAPQPFPNPVPPFPKS